MTDMIYVCDLCGSWQEREETSYYVCGVCLCESAWEFPLEKAQAARDHAHHIESLSEFRRVG